MSFPSIVKKPKKDDEDERLLSIFKWIHINLSFLEAMIHMPNGAKVLKDILSHKEKLEKVTSSVKLSEECSAIIQRSLPQKEGDLGSFTLPCLIGPLVVPKKGGMTVVKNEKNKLISQRTVTGWRELIEDSMEVSIDDFFVFGSSFDHYLKNLEKMLKRCEETDLVLNWENATSWLRKESPLAISSQVQELSDYTVGAVLGKRIDKHFKPIHYARKTMNEAQESYTTTKKELLAIVFAFDKFCQYLVISKTIVFTDHFALRYLFTKQDAKSYLIRWILLLQEFNIEIRDKKDAKNLAADHLSRLENPDLGKLNKAEIRDLFPEE
ncbi:reverse transcriptase domain-containing protein [Tanacetum coccineum]